MSETKAYRIHLRVKGTMTVEKLEEVIHSLTAAGMAVNYDARERYCQITIVEPSHLGQAPQGSIEFAKGWIIRGQMDLIRKYIGPTFHALDTGRGWTVLELDQNGQVRKHHKEVIPWNLKWKTPS